MGHQSLRKTPFTREGLADYFRSEEFQRSGLSRREFLSRGGALALALGATGPFLKAQNTDAQTPSSDEASSGPPELPDLGEFPEALKGTGEVRVSSSGGAFAEAEMAAYWQPFSEMSGITVVPVEGFSGAQVKAQVDSGNVQFDVVSFDYLNVLSLLREGDYFEPINYDLIDTENIDPKFQQEFGLGNLGVGTVMNYRTDAFPDNPPSSWADFWDLENFPGPRNWMSGSIGISPFLEGALLADGVAKDELYPLDIERAFNKLTEIRDDIVKFWESGAQSAQLMADGETVMGVAWNGRIADLQDQGVPVEISWEGGMLVFNHYAVLKGSPNVENAMKFIAFATMAIPQARRSILLPYGFTNNKAAEYLSEDVLQRLPTSPAYADKVFLTDTQWWAENLSAVTEAWNVWAIS